MNGDGWNAAAFTNPVIPGFYPDPSICRAGPDYYLACSSFEYYPGVPIFRSRDLVHWEQIGNALERLPLPDTTPSSGGVYAPTLRYHDERFWLITSDVSAAGTVLFSATDPAGPWSEPVRVPGVPGIDPDLAWDDEGRCWCTYAGIEQVRIDPLTGRTLGNGRVALSAFALAGGRVDVVLFTSGPGPLRFGPPLTITSKPFDPAEGTASGGKHGAWWIGDYQGLASSPGALHPFWNDTRTGQLELFTATVNLTSGRAT